jgi:hypothetical protein
LETNYNRITMSPFKKFAFILFILPFSICGQWTHGYATGQGNGYGTSSRHDTFDGYIKGDSLITFGVQVIGSKFSPDYEYFQDSYSLNDGDFGMSKIIYQWDGAVTNSRKLQSYSRYANGYVVNKSGHGETSVIRYIRDLNGSLIRIDSARRTLIRTNQLIDTTHSFLCSGQGLDLFLLDWFTGDTIQTFISDSIAQTYNGGLNPTNWDIAFYHNDGTYIYLTVAEPPKVFSYGYEVLKLNILTGKLENFRTFTEESSNYSSSQNFAMIVKDSSSEFGNNYRSFLSIYDSQWQKTISFSFISEKFYGYETGSVPVYFSDSLIIFNSAAEDPRSTIPNIDISGSYLKVFDLVNRKWLGSARFFAQHQGRSLDLGKILGVKNGFIYLNTQHDVANFNYSLLMCLPLDLNYNSSLFYRLLGDLEEEMSGSLEIFPNPVSEFLNLNYGATFDEIRFYDQAGRLIGASPYSEENRYSTEFLTPGIYYLSIIAGESTIDRKRFLKIDQ